MALRQRDADSPEVPRFPRELSPRPALPRLRSPLQDLALGSLAGAGSGPGSGLATPTAGGAGAGAGVDLRSAYREVLAGGRPGDMPLMRLMQRSGPVWNELGHELGCQLLVSFISSLQATRPVSSGAGGREGGLVDTSPN